MTSAFLSRTLGQSISGQQAPRPGVPGRTRLRAFLFVLMALLSYLLFSRYVLSTVQVCGTSMSPTLHNGDRFLLNRIDCLLRLPQRGDVVVIRDPVHGEYAVKRIVALPQEHVCLQRNIIHVNGRRLVEPYLPASAVDTEDAALERPFTIKSDHYFVMGDNRNNSEDSRAYGAVPRHLIAGVINLGSQPLAFLGAPVSQVMHHAAMLPLPTVAASAAESTPQHPARVR